MIDWVTMKVACWHAPINGGEVLILDQAGNVERSSDRWASVEGSWCDTLQVRTAALSSDGWGSWLWISGNPVKWFQGHNLFGTDDLYGLGWATAEAVMRAMGQELAWYGVGFQAELTRVDVTYNFQVGTRERARAWLHAAGAVASGRKQGHAWSGGTLYIGKGSKRSSVKMYVKGDEIKVHPPSGELPSDVHAKLVEHADDLLRVELTLRGEELKRLGLRTLASWHPGTAGQVWRYKMENIKLPAQVELVEREVCELPGALVGVYEAWRAGRDLREHLPRATWYRYRRALLAYGIDLAKPPRDVTHNNVIPLLNVIEAQPASVPEWAKPAGVMFEPAPRLRVL